MRMAGEERSAANLSMHFFRRLRCAGCADAMQNAAIMFIAIIVPPAREHKNVLFAVVLAILASYAFN